MNMKMTKEMFGEMYGGQKTVVHCPTEELAKEFLKMAKGFGYIWASGEGLDDIRYRGYKSETCYSLNNYKTVTYSPKRFYESEGREIVEFKGSTEGKDLYTVTSEGYQFNTYTAFFFENKQFLDLAKDYTYKNGIKRNTTVEIVGAGKHSLGGYGDVIVMRDITTGQIGLTQMEGLTKVESEPTLPDDVKSIETKGDTTKVTLKNGNVGYAKCVGADGYDSLIGFSVAYTKSKLGMSAEEIREFVPKGKEKQPRLELYHAGSTSSCGDVGTPTSLKDCDGRPLFVGDMVKITMNGVDHGTMVVACDGEDFVMGIKGTKVLDGSQKWKVKFVRPYTHLKDGDSAHDSDWVRVRAKK